MPFWPCAVVILTIGSRTTGRRGVLESNFHVAHPPASSLRTSCCITGTRLSARFGPGNVPSFLRNLHQNANGLPTHPTPSRKLEPQKRSNSRFRETITPTNRVHHGILASDSRLCPARKRRRKTFNLGAAWRCECEGGRESC